MEDTTHEEVELTPEQEAVKNLSEAFKQLNIKAEVVACEIKGPLRRYSVRPIKVRLQRLQSLAEDLALIMGPKAPPIVRPDYESKLITLEMMFDEHPLVEFTKLARGTGLNTEAVTGKCRLPLLLGTTDIDVPLILDLANMPHMVLAGSTGSGKSMMLHSIINSLLLNAKTVGIEMALIDPKYVEFNVYKDSDAMRYPDVYSSLEDANGVLEELQEQMNRRLKVFKKYGCRDIIEYREKVKRIPYIVLVIDEIADLIKGTRKANKLFEQQLCGLAQKSRAAGIHIVIATQHPSAKVLTSEILQNFPCKIACKVSKAIHSRVVLEIAGAEKLMGKGDALLLDSSGTMMRFKGAFIDMKAAAVNAGANKKKKTFLGTVASAMKNGNKKAR